MTHLQDIKNLPTTPYFGIVAQSRAGVMRAFADEVAQTIRLTDKEMAYILGMTPRHLHRLLPNQYFSTEASERLLLFKNIVLHALDTFENKPTVVLNWLRTPIRELNHQSPIQLMDTVTGFGLVDDVLGRLDYGIVA